MHIHTAKIHKGFTLVELLIAIILVLFLMSAAITLHLTGRQSSIDTEALSRMQENVRFASDYMVRDVRNAGFRDEATLKWGHEEQIRDAYAAILVDADTASTDGNGSRLRVRYAGRGHCTEAFNEYRLVENEYFLSDDGELMCQGRSLTQVTAGSTPITSIGFGTPVGLVRGLTSLEFDTISTDGAACTFNLSNYESDPETTNLCTGVTITMEFAGMQSMNNPAVTEEYRAQLTAAFRNVILEIVNYNSFVD